MYYSSALQKHFQMQHTFCQLRHNENQPPIIVTVAVQIALKSE